MTRLPPTTPTGLARLSPEDEDLLIQSSGGQTIRARRQPGPQLSAEGRNTLFGGAPPADAPQVFGPDFAPEVEGAGSQLNALINEARRGNRSSQLLLEEAIEGGAPINEGTVNSWFNEARRGDPHAVRALQRVLGQEAEAARVTRRASIARQEEQRKALQAEAQKQYNSAMSYLREKGIATEENIGQVVSQLQQQYGSTTLLPPPNSMTWWLTLKDNPELMEVSLSDLKAEQAIAPDPERLAKIEMLEQALVGPEEATKRQQARFAAEDQRMQREADSLAREKRALVAANQVPIPIVDPKTGETTVYRVSPYSKIAQDALDPKHPSHKDVGFRAAVAIANIERGLAEFGGPRSEIADDSAAVEKAHAAQASASPRVDELAAVPAPPGQPAPLAPAQAQQLFASGQLRPGQPFPDEAGNIRAYNLDGSTYIVRPAQQ